MLWNGIGKKKCFHDLARKCIFSLQKCTFWYFKPPSGGQHFDVSKVWLVGCLNFCQRVTKTYQVKKLGNFSHSSQIIQKTVHFDMFSRKGWKWSVFGIFVKLYELFSTFFTWYLLVTLWQKFRHPKSHTFETSKFWPSEGGLKYQKVHFC